MEDRNGFTMGSTIFTWNRFFHDFKWAIIGMVAIASLTSCDHVIRPPNATAPVLETKIYAQVTTTAANADIGETFSVVPAVELAEPGTPDHLLLGVPIATPTGVYPETPTSVIFRVQIDGTSAPPEVLYLDELDLAGKPLKLAVAELRDNGKCEDTKARDQIYSGTFEIDRPASELRFRVRATYFGEEVVSGGTPFLVTPFPLQARLSDPNLLVPMTGTPSRVFANEVEIKTIPGVSPNDLKEIAASINGTVVGVIPPLHIYLIEFPGDGSARDVKEAIATVSAFSQVESAAPNFEMADSAINFNFGTACEATAADCPNDGNPQWYLDKIGARLAWELAGGGSSSARVAVVDGGVNCFQGDLNGRCMASGSNEHATQVAGVIAANANNGNGIAGVAWNTELESIDVGVGNGFAFKQAITLISDDVKVLNISQQVHLFESISGHVTEIGFLREAICYAVDAGKLVVIAAGNIVNESDEDSLYPAKFGGETTHTCPGPENRIMANQLLTVGGSNQDDERATWGGTLRSSDADYLDIYAPGVGIHTITSPNGTVTVSGTSFATAQVAGAAAVLWAHGAFVTPAGETRAKAVHDRLKATADPAISICATCKRLNLAAAFTIAPTPNPPTPNPPSNLNVVSLDGSNGFVIDGADTGDGAGYSVDTADNLNNDGLDDIAIGALYGGDGSRIHVLYGGQETSVSEVF
jgi:subtilisin family serine protease